MLKPGHAAAIPPEAFGQAIDAFLAWESGEPEPTVECKGRQLPISQICGLPSNCSDVISSNHFNTLSGECDLEIEGQTSKPARAQGSSRSKRLWNTNGF